MRIQSIASVGSKGAGPETPTDEQWEGEGEESGPLPQGWERKVDHKTGRPYFEK